MLRHYESETLYMLWRIVVYLTVLVVNNLTELVVNKVCANVIKRDVCRIWVPRFDVIVNVVQRDVFRTWSRSKRLNIVWSCW